MLEPNRTNVSYEVGGTNETLLDFTIMVAFENIDSEEVYNLYSCLLHISHFVNMLIWMYSWNIVKKDVKNNQSILYIYLFINIVTKVVPKYPADWLKTLNLWDVAAWLECGDISMFDCKPVYIASNDTPS